MEWRQDGIWKKWFAWKPVFIPGSIGKTKPKIVWFKMVERKVVVNRGIGTSSWPYVTYNYREYHPL